MTRAVRGACRRIYGAFDEFAPCGVSTLNAVEGRLADEGATRRSLRVSAILRAPPGTFRESVAALPRAVVGLGHRRRRSTGAASRTGPHEGRP